MRDYIDDSTRAAAEFRIFGITRRRHGNFIERLANFRCQRPPRGTQILLCLFERTCTDDDAGHSRTLDQPTQGELSRRTLRRRGQGQQLGNDLALVRRQEGLPIAEPLAARRRARALQDILVLAIFSGQQAAREGASTRAWPKSFQVPSNRSSCPLCLHARKGSQEYIDDDSCVPTNVYRFAYAQNCVACRGAASARCRR